MLNKDSEKLNLTLGEIRTAIKNGEVAKIALNVHSTISHDRDSTYVDEMMVFPVSKSAFLRQYKDFPNETEIVSRLTESGYLEIG